MSNFEVWAVNVSRELPNLSEAQANKIICSNLYYTYAIYLAEPEFDDEEIAMRYYGFMNFSRKEWIDWVEQYLGAGWKVIALTIAREGYKHSLSRNNREGKALSTSS